jgi:uncharacterized membrane protein YhaH (DUF805 family)
MLKNIFNYKGRGSRTEFSIYGILFILYFVAYSNLTLHLSTTIDNYNETIGYKLLIIFNFLIYFPSVTICIRRLHDIGKKGANLFWSLTIVGIIPLLYWTAIKRGNEYDNEYGVRIEPFKYEKFLISLYLIIQIVFIVISGLEINKTFQTISDWQEANYGENKSIKIIERYVSDLKRNAMFKVLLVCDQGEMGYLVFPYLKNSVRPNDPPLPFAIDTNIFEVSIYSSSENLRNQITVTNDLESKFVTLEFNSNLKREKLINEEIAVTFKNQTAAYQLKIDMKSDKVAKFIKECK